MDATETILALVFVIAPFLVVAAIFWMHFSNDNHA